jgi:hypothetical protein
MKEKINKINYSVDLELSQFKSQEEAVNTRDYLCDDFADILINPKFIGSGCGMGDVDFQYHAKYTSKENALRELNEMFKVFKTQDIKKAIIRFDLLDDNDKDIKSYRTIYPKDINIINK